ncbi:MAG: pyridoxal 5'-phosphate synthase glutaminase subunit PdxT [Caldilineaceae bacterium SB0675_bin_29]|uniref:Pyridoxal 5'-phosphate synthase subunit PdxT n=1 Tax=Caldilineaceae bacterium SB0675_bin_29 TaxID=2605266 RepID=A0A6B1FWG2_9CHLR|nr:pyridoxal 5'-phosphate synthase glutaminase subunit PdxT [Caldilineaceae bacterium SB0675_bin_29]
MSGVRLGVLALQGAFREHIAMLKRLNVEAVEVRLAQELDGLDGLIIPGGESTSMGLVAERWGLVEPLRRWVRGGKPTWGTCAGMILLAENATGQKLGGQALIGGLNVTVNRNYFGRQVDSFEANLDVPALGDAPFHAVFIRAPAITEVAEGIETLATVASLGDETESVIAAVRKGPILATAFHPELTDDLRWHRYFVKVVTEYKSCTG